MKVGYTRAQSILERIKKPEHLNVWNIRLTVYSVIQSFRFCPVVATLQADLWDYSEVAFTTLSI